MKIGIEAQRIFRKKKHGMDMVVLELIRNLQQIDTVNEYVVFVNPDEDDKVLPETPNFKIVKLDGGSYPVWEQYALPKAAKAEGCHILHCTSNTAPVCAKIPLVVTLHDIIYMESSYMAILRGSASLYQKFGNIYRRMVVPRVVKKSSKIITVSHFEKNRIGDFFHLSGDKRLTAVYNGVSTHFKPVTNLTDLQQVKTKYKLPDHFFFFLGNTDPKKNTKGVLKAYADYVKQYGDTYKLVMLDYDLAELSSLLSDMGSPELISNIILTGYVANTDLPAIYSQCAVFLYPSLRESFGIPMLEAMACGVPVITSNTSSMPEVAGDAAILVDPFKPGEITAAIHFLTQESDLRNSLLKKGISRASEFSWLKMAEDVKDIYEEVYKQSYQK
jgi:glycosyltransferase involved in cell wall biosynthesis